MKKDTPSTPFRRPRQTDIAERAGVSPSTVSKILRGSSDFSEEVCQRIRDAAQEIGFPLPDLSSKKNLDQTRHIKLVTYYQFLTQHSSYFHFEVINAVQEECKKEGLEIETVLLSRDDPNDIADYEARLAQSPTDAVIFMGIDAPEFLDPVRGMNIPAVIVNGVDPESAFDSISPALRDGSRLATRHLLSLGHTDIIHVTHLYRKVIHQRLGGFRDALEEAGIEFCMERHVINLPGGHFSAEEASDAIYEKITQNQLKATAFFCVSDYTALGVIQGLQRAGFKVPEDYSVASFDDLPLAQLTRPSITSAGVDRQDLGRLTVERLLARLREPHRSTLRTEIGARLSVRSSTAPVKKA